MTGFTPELVERVAKAIALAGYFASDSGVPPKASDFRDEARAALEASGIAELTEALRLARGIIVEDANACRAFRDESEGLSGPENVLNKIDAILAKIGGEG